ncbi:hypothetical protein OsI_19528 [Oryza sativa Indica Group]|uniref:DUF3778 domain-containing protein n=1 Tax=Oryza sativa subsp. indica TaxID=39946 RepID=B8AX39_ORYSI|nr:hypothetical protein OsI_19528 [Oryza sativa Indica Group]
MSEGYQEFVSTEPAAMVEAREQSRGEETAASVPNNSDRGGPVGLSLVGAVAGKSPWVSVSSAFLMVGGGGGARSEDQWKNRRMEMAPCGGVGCNSVFGQEVADLLLATTATASRGLRRLDLLSLGAPSSWCMMIARRRCGGGFSGAWTRASNAKVPSVKIHRISLPHPWFVVRLELTLLRFNGELRGHLLLSLGMLTPKSTA